jgi:hypothetical protein
MHSMSRCKTYHDVSSQAHAGGESVASRWFELSGLGTFRPITAPVTGRQLSEPKQPFQGARNVYVE